MPLDLSRLNPRQKEAVLHDSGPLLVLAGAGSGKTSTMAYRISHLVAKRKLPGTAILGLSFTNKAAGELKERVIGLVSAVPGGSSLHRGLTVSTFHSLCARILRAHAGALGFQANFTIVDEGDRKDVLRQIMKNIRIDDRKFDLDRILFEFGNAKSRMIDESRAEAHFLESGRLPSDYAIAAASAFGHYQRQLRILNAMDFDDLLFHGVRLLSDHSDIRDHYNKRFQHILVDEYQDTNPIQFKLLELLTQRQKNLCVVGDDDQSIYSWRGADAAHILGFGRHFPGTRTVILDQNYRSTSMILEAANSVIANNRTRYAKKLWSDRGRGVPIEEIIVEDDRAEAELVAELIGTKAKQQNRPFRDFAILYRSNAQSRVFEEALRRNRLPYKIVGGMSFLDRKEVKDVLSYWRLIVNPADDASVRRVINWPARGIGKSTIEAVHDLAFKKGVSFYEALRETGAAGGRAATGITSFQSAIEGLRAKLASLPPEPAKLAAWGEETLQLLGVKRAVEEENEDPVQFARKWENVQELVHSLGQISVKELEKSEKDPLILLRDYLTRMALDAKEEEDEDSDLDTESDQITLLTLHGAKGLEYPIVHLVGMEEGFLPHRRSIDEGSDLSEERRLCYVGITRARDSLILTRARSRIRYGKPVPRLRSRFLQEIPGELIVTEDHSHGPDATDSDEARKAHEERVKDHLSQIKALLGRPK